MNNKKYICILIFLLLVIINSKAICSNSDTIPWKYAHDAINNGIKMYFNHIELNNRKFSKYTVFVIKIVSLKENKGEF
jgi:hypothetical protein